MNDKLESEILEALEKIRLRHRFYKPVNIIVTDNVIKVTEITDNIEYTNSHIQENLKKQQKLELN